MGLVWLFCGFIGLSIGGALGVYGISIHKKRNNLNNIILWFAFIALSIIVFLIIAYIGYELFPNEESSLSPRGDGYSSIMMGMFVIGISPGCGLLISAIVFLVNPRKTNKV